MSCLGARRVPVTAGHLDGISVPGYGEWTVRVWLEDAAGNVDSSRWSDATLRYGSAPVVTSPDPGAPSTPAGSTPATTPEAPGDQPASEAFLPVANPMTVLFRRSPALKLTSARITRDGVLVRGTALRSSARRLSLTLRLRGGTTLKRSVTTRGGRFALTLRALGVRTLRGSVQAQLSGDAAFLPASATLRLGA